MKRAIYILLLLLQSFSFAQLPGVSLSKIEAPPLIDGELNDSCWKSATKIQLSHLQGKTDTPSQKTEVLLAYDDFAIYIAFICYEDKMDKIVANRKEKDGDIWRDDCVEIFLSPNPPDYFHFIVNSLGTQQDEINKDARWNGDWKVKTKKFPDRWQVEISIPFLSLPLSRNTGAEWRGNFCRNELPHKEESSWTILEKSFHEPQNFGLISFPSPPPFSTIAERQIKEAGEKMKDQLRKILAEADKSKGEIGEIVGEKIRKILDGLENGEIDPRNFSLSSLEPLVNKMRLANETNSPYIICRESSLNKIRKDQPYFGKPAEELTVYCARNEKRSAQLVILPLQNSLKDVLITLSNLKGRNGAINRENLSLNLVGYVETKIPTKGAEPGLYPDPLLPYKPFDVSLESIQPVWLTISVPPSAKAGWYEGRLEIKPSNAPSKKIKLRLYVFNFSLPPTPSIKTVFPLYVHYLQKYYRNLRGNWGWFETSPQRWDSEAISLSRDAIEGDYSLLAPPTDLRYSHLVSPYQGTCDENTFVSFAYKSNDEGMTFLLFGTAEGNRFFFPREQEKGKWHRAKAKLVECGVPVGSFFTLQFVHDYEGGRHSFLIDDVEVYREKNGEREVLYKENFENFSKETFGELVRKYRLNMLEHRVSDESITAPHIEVEDRKVKIDWSEFDKEISFYLDKGLNGFNISWLRIPSGWGEAGKPDPKQMEISAEIIRQTEKHLEKKGWLKYAYVFTIDEPSRKDFPIIKEIHSFIKEHGPRLRTRIDLGYGATRPWEPGAKGLPAYSEIADYIDILVPHIDCFHPDYLKSLKRKGKEIWMYVCISAQKPYPNIWAIDYPGIDHRIIFWQCFKYDVEGFVYWSINYWEKNPWEETQTYPGGNGDGSLVYPGEDGPINSIRWEIIREGVQDYEYLSILKKKVGEEKAKEYLKGIVDDFTHYTQDPEKLERRRIEIGKMIERL